jgi:hypothetical protein
MHPPPGSNTPSFTAVVGNVDADAAKYIATSRVQTGRLEMIKDLYEMSKVCFHAHIPYFLLLSRLYFQQDDFAEL